MRSVQSSATVLLLVLALAMSLLAGCAGESGNTPSGNPAENPGGTETRVPEGEEPSDPTTPGEEPENTPAPVQNTLGSEYAAEPEPAVAIVDKAAEILGAVPGGEWDNSMGGKSDPADAEYASASMTYYMGETAKFLVSVVWNKTTSAVTSIEFYVYTEDNDVDKSFCAALFSNDLMDGLGDLYAACTAPESLVCEGASSIYTSKGFTMFDQGSSMLRIYRISYFGSDMRLDGNILYYIDGAVAIVYGLVEGDGLPQTLIIPENLGGCPVTEVSFLYYGSYENYYSNVIAIPATAEIVDFTYALPAIFLLPEHVKTIRCSTTVNLQAYAPMILCTGRETEIDMGIYSENQQSFTGREKPTIQAFFGSELAEYAREKEWDLGYLDAIEGDRDAARAYLSGLLADRLALLVSDSPEAAEELAENASFEELLDLVMENWDDAMEDAGDPGMAKEQLEKLKAGDYSDLESAWSHNEASPS